MRAIRVQRAMVMNRWRHLIDEYGTLDLDQARAACHPNHDHGDDLRHDASGALPPEVLGFVWKQGVLYPRFQFDKAGINRGWRDVAGGLLAAGWDAEDILLWMVSPNGRVSGREPVSLLDTDFDTLRRLITQEAKGVW